MLEPRESRRDLRTGSVSRLPRHLNTRITARVVLTLTSGSMHVLTSDSIPVITPSFISTAALRDYVSRYVLFCSYRLGLRKTKRRSKEKERTAHRR